ncbi:LysE family translocator [Halioxenophilus sp. WMMB6]|uniref:LysE family translocator n=1 Tax=Halioxenophilus sp. WMMB6 TaxID=3073815 RepID=UPI00295EFF0A|nr:LysE family translocator [Halioxenophilus sp. WMMB6]
MLGINDIWLFIGSGIVLNILPGPDSLFVISRSASQGFKAGSAATLGIGSGIIVHVLIAAFGLSALLAASSLAFTVVKYLGALYLLYMAMTLIISRGKPSEGAVATPLPTPLRVIYRQGFFTNVLNPKVALFFLAFVPQFIEPESANKALAFIVLGMIFNCSGMLWCHLLAWTSASASRRLKASGHVSRWLNRAGGALFAYFGIKLALSSQI